jgi:hypothetical protein
MIKKRVSCSSAHFLLQIIWSLGQSTLITIKKISIWQGDITIRPEEVGMPDASTPMGLTVIKDAKGQLWDSVSYFWAESWITNGMVYRRGLVAH